MQIYTRQGDDGKTMLLDRQRVWKDDPRVQVGGALDELCSWIGVASAHMPAARPELVTQLREVQNELFAVGAAAQLAGRMDKQPTMRMVGVKECERIEGWIDAMKPELPAMHGFIAPGGCAAAAFVHVARGVCRRAESGMVSLLRNADAEGAATLADAVAYLNRLSDFLFVLARFCNHLNGVEETVIGRVGGECGGCGCGG
jgi:cob(I)alamin adenosyltransferase